MCCLILEDPVDRGQAYAVAVVADGFKPVGGDEIVLATEDDPATVDMGTIKLATKQ